MTKPVKVEDIKFYEPNEVERNIIATALFSMIERRLFVKKISNKEYQIYCPNCQRYETISAQQLKQVRASQTCPFCFERYSRLSYKNEVKFDTFVSIEDKYGYHVIIEWRFGNVPKITRLEQTMYFEYFNEKEIKGYGYYGAKYKFKGYKKHCGMNMFSGLSYWCCEDEWKLTRNSNYITYCYEYNYIFNKAPVNRRFPSKKEWLEEELKGIELKSNQKYIAITNLLNKTQILLMRAFDLKSCDEVIEYSKKVKKAYDFKWNTNYDHIDNILKLYEPLNKYFLDYLIANTIHFGDYKDYMRDLKYIDRKYDKPKNFNDAHHEISKLASEKRKANIDPDIKKRCATLPSYKNKEIKIAPFKSGDEIRKCAAKLHNCIASYIRDYANGETDLYHLDVNGKLKVAIEICDGELRQAKIVNNGSCPNDLFKHVQKFCTKNNIKTRSDRANAF